ncbi:MAG: hypothetical protein H6848_03260 [Caulobacterales bacterium]|nr:hypothetical protein [Caulobacterales bacterium]
MALQFSELEHVYDKLAVTLDGIDDSERDLFLAKLVLALAYKAGSIEDVLESIEKCSRGINPAK